MLNERLNAAKKVADASRLAIAVIEGRKAAKLPLDTGQEGLALVSRATAKLVEARGDICAAHVAFRETQQQIGLRSVSFGDFWESPDKKKPLAELQHGVRAA
jgi:hypothetical protein